MKKTIMMIGALVLLGCFLTKEAAAQEGMGPQGGDLSFSLILGKTQMLPSGFLTLAEVDQAPYTTNVNDMNNPYINPPSINFYTGNTLTSMVGVEIKYFFSPELAVRFSGSGSINSSPALDAVPSVIVDNQAILPGHRMTTGRTMGQYFANLGVDYYFSTGRERVHPYAGVQFNGAYGLMEVFDGYRGLSWNEEPHTIWDVRRGEVWGLGGSLVGGVDYFLAEGFFFGFEIKAVSYVYTGKHLFHQPGMEAQGVGVHNTSFLAMPMVKIGFSF